jgi:hypothetical protein
MGEVFGKIFICSVNLTRFATLLEKFSKNNLLNFFLEGTALVPLYNVCFLCVKVLLFL